MFMIIVQLVVIIIAHVGQSESQKRRNLETKILAHS